MKHRQDVLVKCPYYKGEDKQEIICEGVQKDSAIHLTFDTPANLRDYKKRFCKGWCFNRCLIADMLNRKYEYEET